MLASPEARGLFQHAIVQSGNGLAFSPEQAQRVTHAAATSLGINPAATDFARVPDEQLVDVLPKLAGLDLRTNTRFDPLLGLSPFSLVLQRQPAEAVAASTGSRITLMVGTNTEEGNLYLVPQGNPASLTIEDVHDTAAKVHSDPANLVTRYRAQAPQPPPGQLRSAIMGDALFRTGSRRLAEAHVAHEAGHTYTYDFAWRSSAVDGRLGATHTVELPYVFDRLHDPALHGPRGLLGPTTPLPDLSARMHDAWVNFAHSGNPGWYPSQTQRFA